MSLSSPFDSTVGGYLFFSRTNDVVTFVCQVQIEMRKNKVKQNIVSHQRLVAIFICLLFDKINTQAWSQDIVMLITCGVVASFCIVAASCCIVAPSCRGVAGHVVISKSCL